MPKDKPQTDTVFELAQRQSMVAKKIHRAGRGDDPEPLDAEGWSWFLNDDIPVTIMTKPSERFREAIQKIDTYGSYTSPQVMRGFFWVLFDEFAASRQEYVRRGWVTQAPEAAEVVSTMESPLPGADLMGEMLEMEERE